MRRPLGSRDDSGRERTLRAEDLRVHVPRRDSERGEAFAQRVHERDRPAHVELAIERNAGRVERLGRDASVLVVVDTDAVGRAGPAVPDAMRAVREFVDE